MRVQWEHPTCIVARDTVSNGSMNRHGDAVKPSIQTDQLQRSNRNQTTCQTSEDGTPKEFLLPFREVPTANDRMDPMDRIELRSNDDPCWDDQFGVGRTRARRG